MSEMIERVARALCVKAGYIPDCEHLDGGKHLDRFIEPARAAIDVMKTPTEAMLDAALAVASWDYELDERKQAEVYWPAMIDAALKDNTQPGERE